MKKVNSITYALSFAGFFLGAGYVSGQELWQFFGMFGKLGIIGIAVAVILLASFGIILLRLVQITNKSDIGEVVVMWDNKIIRNIFIVLEVFFLFGVYVIMTAGIGALFNQIFGIPSFVSSVIFTLIVGAIVIIGVNGLMKAFSVTVPCLVVASVAIFIYLLATKGIAEFGTVEIENENPLISNWFVSAVVFVSYNLFTSIGIITPFGKMIKDKKTVFVGTILGSLILFIIAVVILMSLSTDMTAVKTELPMLSLASGINKFVAYIFALLLFFGMFGTSASSLFAIDDYFTHRFNFSKKKSTILIICTCVLSFIASLFGFADLIGVVYPICGYLGISALILIVIHFIYAKREKLP